MDKSHSKRELGVYDSGREGLNTEGGGTEEKRELIKALLNKNRNKKREIEL